MSYAGQPDPYRQPQHQQPTQPSHYPPAGYRPPSPASRETLPSRKGIPVPAVIAIAAGAALVGALFGAVATGAGQDDADPLADATERPVVESSTPEREREDAEPTGEPEPTTVTIPDDMVGANAAIAEDRLRELGIARVEFGSVDADDTVVIVASNWTVVSVEPEPGTEVSTDSLVVLSVTKQ